MKSKSGLLLLLLTQIVFAENTVTEVISLYNRTATELLPLIGPLLENTDTVVDNADSLIVKTTSERMPYLQNLIHKLDSPISNLVITVLQNSSETAEELNAKEYSAKNMSDAIQMHGMNADTREINHQQKGQFLRVTPGQPAYIKTSQIKQEQNTNGYGVMNGNPIYNSSSQQQEISTGFVITPQITGQQVMMDIEPWFEQFQQGNRIDTHSTHSQIRTKLGEWVELGGNSNINVETNSGFNTYNHQISKNNLRILIKVDRVD
ncbi:type II and III secretion system protein [Methylomonas sp. AM2-LC]|uniref:type II and III secretion system protein n=1 Tax=Methylomonas sp. AM2-LC TaxID=3153301 RepID=UPI00326435FE